MNIGVFSLLLQTNVAGGGAPEYRAVGGGMGTMANLRFERRRQSGRAVGQVARRDGRAARATPAGEGKAFGGTSERGDRDGRGPRDQKGVRTE